MQNHHKKIIIIGSGFSGIGMAVKLKKKGLHDFVILEKSQDIGGTWRDNSYPGAECDVPSPVYSFSFYKSPRWSQLFGRQSEILSYLKEVTYEFGLYDHIQFGTKVTKAEFNESLGCWQIESASGALWTCQHLILGTGGLSRPQFPQIAGLEKFKGPLVHTAGWQHQIKMQNKRVGVIGNGASGIQVVPAIVGEVGSLKVFQRTPSWILPKMSYHFSEWEQEILAKFPLVQTLMRWFLYCLFEFRALGLFSKTINKLGQKQALKFLHKKIKDPQLRSKLTPQYQMGCKRILLSNTYYDALALDKVELVTESIKEVTETGVVTQDGKEHALDILVCATGFKVVEEPLPFPIFGINSHSLQKTWDQDGVQAFLGTTVSGFPNLGILMGPNTGLGHNSMVYMIESQIEYYAQGISYIDTQRVDYMDVKKRDQETYNQSLQKRFRGSVWTEGGCKSWYQNKRGNIVALWPGFSFSFRQKLARFNPEAYQFYRIEALKDRLTPRLVTFLVDEQKNEYPTTHLG